MVVHGTPTSTGRVGNWLKARGYRFDVRCPRCGDALPETLEEHEGVVVFGGHMSANDPDDYIRREIDWMSVPLREEKPLLGICLGAQMLAKSLGGEVCTRADGLVECGYTPIEASRAGRSFVTWPSHVYHWHREGFTLPKDARLLASSQLFPNQAFQYGRNAFGVQFHPETTLARMHHLMVEAGPFLSLPGAHRPEAHISAHDAHGHATLRWLNEFMRRWLQRPEGGSASAA